MSRQHEDHSSLQSYMQAVQSTANLSVRARRLEYRTLQCAYILVYHHFINIWQLILSVCGSLAAWSGNQRHFVTLGTAYGGNWT
jgi:hypothetical protein